MRYLIDGYNLLFYLTKKSNPLHQYRHDLISYFANSVSSLDVVLVFDGNDPHEKYSTKHHIEELEIIYTPQSITADHYIFEEVQIYKNKKKITVVSNDQALVRSCKSLGAYALSLTEFLSYIARKKNKHKKTKSSKETPQEVSRLLKIFEKKLQEE